MIKYFFVILVSFSLVSPLVSLAQSSSPILTGPPESTEDFKKLGQRALDVFPGALKQALGEALALWGRMLDWIRGLNTNLGSEAAAWWQRIQSWFRERAEIFKTEFQKEKQEMLQDIQKIVPQLLKDLWQRIHS